MVGSPDRSDQATSPVDCFWPLAWLPISPHWLRQLAHRPMRRVFRGMGRLGDDLCFAVIAGIGFASVNIADVTAARASRVTPAVTAAQSASSDAMSARDRECGNGVGNCREREAAIAERRHILDAGHGAGPTDGRPSNGCGYQGRRVA
jgi:hypothetical protein